MDIILQPLVATSRDLKTAQVVEVDVIKIAEEEWDMKAIEVDTSLDSDTRVKLDESFNANSSLAPDKDHPLDEDSVINVDVKTDASIVEDAASKETESSEAYAVFTAMEERLPGAECSSVTTEAVDTVETVQVPPKKSKWLTTWFMEAAEWEGCSWSRRVVPYASTSVQCGAAEQGTPSSLYSKGHILDPSAQQRLRERFLSTKDDKQLK